MTEQQLITAGFSKEEVNHLESNNEHDYYYYILDLCEGVCLVSIDNDDAIDDIWYVKSFDVPALKIRTLEHLNDYLKLVRTLTGCENV